MYLFVLGAGLGFTMQVVVTAVQNAVDRRDLGAATSSVAFFRSMGGAFGTALFGAVLNSRLADHLADTTGVVGGGGEAELATSVQVNQDLPEPVKGQVVEAFVLSLHDVFLSAVPFVLVAVVAALLIPHRHLADHHETTLGRDDPLPAPVE